MKKLLTVIITIILAMPQPAYALRPRATALALQLLPYAREIFALKETDGDQTKAGEILEIGQFSMNKIAKKIRKIATEIGDIETLRMLLYPPHAQERLDALEKAGGNKAEAARHSGITRAGFCYFVKRTTEVATKIEDVETLNRIRRSQLSQLPHHTQATLDALEKAGGNQAEAARIFNITRPSVDARIKRIRKIATETGDNDTLERLEKLLQLARLQLPYYTQATLDALEETGGNRTEAAKILDTRQPYVSRRIKRIRKVATEIGDIETLKRLLLPHHTQATLDALEEAGGNQAEAARILEISQGAMSARIKRIRKIAAEIGDNETLYRLDINLTLARPFRSKDWRVRNKALGDFIILVHKAYRDGVSDVVTLRLLENLYRMLNNTYPKGSKKWKAIDKERHNVIIAALMRIGEISYYSEKELENLKISELFAEQLLTEEGHRRMQNIGFALTHRVLSTPMAIYINLILFSLPGGEVERLLSVLDGVERKIIEEIAVAFAGTCERGVGFGAAWEKKILENIANGLNEEIPGAEYTKDKVARKVTAALERLACHRIIRHTIYENILSYRAEGITSTKTRNIVSNYEQVDRRTQILTDYFNLSEDELDFAVAVGKLKPLVRKDYTLEKRVNEFTTFIRTDDSLRNRVNTLLGQVTGAEPITENSPNQSIIASLRLLPKEQREKIIKEAVPFLLWSKAVKIKPPVQIPTFLGEILHAISELEHYEAINKQERQLLQLMASMGPKTKKELRIKAYDTGITNPPGKNPIRGKPLFNKLFKSLLEKGLIIFVRGQGTNIVLLDQETIRNTAREESEQKTHKKNAEELAYSFLHDLWGEFPEGEKVDKDRFFNLLRKGLRRWTRRHLRLSSFDFSDKLDSQLGSFYVIYQEGFSKLNRALAPYLINSYCIERNIEKLLDSKIKPIIDRYDLPIKIDKIILIDDRTNPRPLRFEKGKNLYRKYGLRKPGKGDDNFLIINLPKLVDARLTRLSLFLTHVIVGHPVFNRGKSGFRTRALAKRLNGGIKDHPHLKGLKFDFSAYPKDNDSVLNILDALCEMIAHKVTFTLLFEDKHISKEEIKAYFESLAIMYLANPKPQEEAKKKIRGAHFAHLVAMAELLAKGKVLKGVSLDIDPWVREGCETKSIQLNGEAHEDLVVDLKSFYNNLFVVIGQEPIPKISPQITAEFAASALRPMAEGNTDEGAVERLGVMNPSSKINLTVVMDKQDVYKIAASKIMADYYRAIAGEKDYYVLGLAAGRTQIGLCKILVQFAKEGRIDFNKIITFSIDELEGLRKEYVGKMTPKDPGEPNISYKAFMYHYLFRPLFEAGLITQEYIDKNVNIFESKPKDAGKMLADYEQKIDDLGGVDTWIGGLGENGHIGYNEPGATSPDSISRRVFLTPSTIAKIHANFEAIGRESPKTAFTIGMATYKKARHPIVIAHDDTKADPVRKGVAGEPDNDLALSLCQDCPNCDLVIDREAASGLGIPLASFVANFKEPNVRSGKEAENIMHSLEFTKTITEPVRIALIMPMYNEQKRLSPGNILNPLGEDALRIKIEQLQILTKANPLFQWRLIAVDDGSRSGACANLVNKLWGKIRDEYAEKRGEILDASQVTTITITEAKKRESGSQKGGAVILGLKKAAAEGWADYIGYTDVDISTNLSQLGNLIRPIYEGNTEVAIGSRWAKGATAEGVGILRTVSSKAYNLYVGKCLPQLKDIKDTQRGFKLFKKDVLETILASAEDETWTFDSELLLLARLAGYRISEIPIAWFDSTEATTLKVSIKEALSLRKNLLRQRKRGSNMRLITELLYRKLYKRQQEFSSIQQAA